MKSLTMRLLRTASLASVIAAAPVTIDLGPSGGWKAFKTSTAAAEDGAGASDDDDDGGSSGSGGGDDDGGNSGAGDDDDGGNSGGGDDDDDDGSSGSDDDDDHGGNSASDDGGNSGSETTGDDDHIVVQGARQEQHEADHRVGPNGEQIEIDGDKIEVTYPDGWKEEIANGIFELKEPNGRTAVERPATAEDLARIMALAG